MKPDVITSEDDFHADVLDWAKAIMELQNSNMFPETGTLGFIMGCAMALGNTVALYETGMDRARRKQFERIVKSVFKDSVAHPFVTGTITNA